MFNTQEINRKIQQINRWLASLNQLEKTIIVLTAIGLGIGGACARRYYWYARGEECEQHRAYYDAADSIDEELKRYWAYEKYLDCSSKLIDDRFNSWL